jgi:phosphohistidine phosphatase
MRLYLVRHGMAEEWGSDGTDRGRALTREGRQRIAYQAGVLRAAGWRVERLLCSPYLRARQTAGILSTALGTGVEEASCLHPGCTLGEFQQLLEPYQNLEAVMVVGHQPYIGRFVKVFTGATAAISTGTVAAIDLGGLQPGMGYLAGLYAPDTLVPVGRLLETSEGPKR